MSRTVLFSWDHAGYPLVDPLTTLAKELGFEVTTLGNSNTDPVDYPDSVAHLIAAMRSEPESVGVLICGSGIGMSIAANRYKGVRAALCTSECEARTARAHNDANILCLGARVIGVEQAKGCLQVFLTTPFAGQRHERRVAKIDSLVLQEC